MIDEPSRPEILFLHGIPTNAALWQPVIDRLDGVRAVAPDLPGYGNAPRPRNPGISAYHRFISAVLASERMRAPILVGHDLGGLYALTHAIANPNRLRALVLMNTTIYADPRVFLGLVPLLAPGFGEAYAWFAGRARYRELHRRGLASMYPAATPESTIHDLTEPYGHTSSWVAVLRSLRGLSQFAFCSGSVQCINCNCPSSSYGERATRISQRQSLNAYCATCPVQNSSTSPTLGTSRCSRNRISLRAPCLRSQKHFRRSEDARCPEQPECWWYDAAAPQPFGKYGSRQRQ